MKTGADSFSRSRHGPAPQRTIRFLAAIILLPLSGTAQNNQPASIGQSRTGIYTLPVQVDEVNLTFSAVDENGISIHNLQPSDLAIRDNGKKPERILSLQPRTDQSIRAGILIDTSNSMGWSLRRNLQIASDFSTRILRSSTDQAFVMRFDFEQLLKQDWTGNSDDLLAGVRRSVDSFNSRIGGTALFDSLYIACRDKFGLLRSGSSGTGNFILLFSDGVDNRSHARIDDVIDICQRTHTAIYVFSNEPKPSADAGHATLKELTEKSGGRIFYNQPGKAPLDDLRVIEQNLRNDYILVYRPAKLKPDGSFHRIKLTLPYRAATITTRTGYYAPRR